jgi:hypothetical protein
MVHRSCNTERSSGAHSIWALLLIPFIAAACGGSVADAPITATPAPSVSAINISAPVTSVSAGETLALSASAVTAAARWAAHTQSFGRMRRDRAHDPVVR